MNDSLKKSPIEIYQVLAHEGLPGHLYQHTYFKKTDEHPLRKIMSCGGYTEGWACYAMGYVTKYLQGGKNLTEFADIAGRVDYLLQGIIDIGVNYKGWDTTRMITELEPYGITNGMTEDQINSMYQDLTVDYIEIQKYCVGDLLMRKLKVNVQNEMGSSYKDIYFHEAVLNAGSVDFDLLEEYVMSAITLKKVARAA